MNFKKMDLEEIKNILNSLTIKELNELEMLIFDTWSRRVALNMEVKNE